MKVALVSEWMDASRGGAETSTLQFMHHLLRRGVDLHVFTRSRPSPMLGLRVHTISGDSISRTRRSVAFTRRTERMLRSESFDVVHAISPFPRADIYQPRGGTVAETVERNLALRKPGITRRLKQLANRVNLRQRCLLKTERRMFENAEGPIVVAISEYVAHQLKEHYGLANDRIRLIYNGVDAGSTTPEERESDRVRIRREYGIGDEDLLVLLIAHNFRLKGVRHWMEALALLRRRGKDRVRSLVIGKGVSPQWRRRAVRLGIDSALTFTGPTDRVRDFRHAANVLVHPTFYDPCSRVVLEAMVAGLPCVTTRWDGASELIDDGRNGYILDEPSDVAALAGCVERLCDPGHRRAVGLAARLVGDRASMARHADEMLVLYEEVAGRTGVGV